MLSRNESFSSLHRLHSHCGLWSFVNVGQWWTSCLSNKPSLTPPQHGVGAAALYSLVRVKFYAPHEVLPHFGWNTYPGALLRLFGGEGNRRFGHLTALRGWSLVSLITFAGMGVRWGGFSFCGIWLEYSGYYLNTSAFLGAPFLVLWLETESICWSFYYLPLLELTSCQVL